MATYFDDIEIGYRSLVGSVRVPAAESVAFAEQWDPQPFHVDEAAAKQSIYAGLTLSSLHLFALCTRLFFDHEDRIAVMAMLGKDEIRFPKPARPGEALSYFTECVDRRASSSKPDRGIIELRDTVTNEAGEIVMSQRVTLMVSRRTRRGDATDLADPEWLRLWAEESGLPLQAEALELVSVGCDSLGREQRMTPECAEGWAAMRAAALESGIELLLVSAFRSVEHQRGIFERKLESGEQLQDILCVNAAPGYSEHHSGRALDLGTPGSEGLTEDFEATPAFAWLCGNAERFGFRLSYPRDNAFGIAYEPWHWAFCSEAEAAEGDAPEGDAAEGDASA